MSATVRLFAGAAEAVGRAELRTDAADVGGLLAELTQLGGSDAQSVLGRCAIIVGGVMTDDPAAAIAEGSVIDVLPPFAGG